MPVFGFFLPAPMVATSLTKGMKIETRGHPSIVESDSSLVGGLTEAAAAMNANHIVYLTDMNASSEFGTGDLSTDLLGIKGPAEHLNAVDEICRLADTFAAAGVLLGFFVAEDWEKGDKVSLHEGDKLFFRNYLMQPASWSGTLYSFSRGGEFYCTLEIPTIFRFK